MNKIELTNNDKENQFENFKVEVELENENIEEIVQIDSNVIVPENQLDFDDVAIEKIIVNTENEIDLNINIGNSKFFKIEFNKT
jgi:hypothetical protein